MGLKRKEQEAAKIKELQRKRRIQYIAASSVAAVAVIGIIAAVYLNSPRELHSNISPDSSGNVAVAASSLGSGLNYFNYGGSQDLVIWKNSSGGYRSAFDVCEECFDTGRAHYTLQNDTLTCESCGTTMALENSGIASWGGCQPVSIPVEYRQDTDSDIVIPSGVLSYASAVFSSWENGDYSNTLENYATQPQETPNE
ncbi:MAG: Fe-S-containing protein [Clostridiales bacterium]|jgi:uncharacterized membrane protein|nr:Fe-S-containing protein [Clostridiales bacterium]